MQREIRPASLSLDDLRSHWYPEGWLTVETLPSGAAESGPPNPHAREVLPTRLCDAGPPWPTTRAHSTGPGLPQSPRAGFCFLCFLESQKWFRMCQVEMSPQCHIGFPGTREPGPPMGSRAQRTLHPSEQDDPWGKGTSGALPTLPDWTLRKTDAPGGQMSFPGSGAAHDLTQSCVTLEPAWKGGQE